MRKISVIIPCYNVSAYIDRCLISITVQTIGVENLEIICIDDSSTDDTWIHLQKWKHVFPENIILVQLEENKRQGAARNVGLQYASAEWISFVDADDWLEFDFFERLYEPVTRLRCDVVSCNFVRDASDLKSDFDADKKNRGKEEYIIADTIEQKKKVLADKPLGMVAHTKIIRKRLLTDNNILFPENVVYEDHYWIPLLHIYAERIYLIEEQLYHYFWNPDSTVLSKNQDHHLDGLTVQIMKWADYKERGLLRKYREELEYDFLWDAVDFVQVILLWRDELPFSFFRLQSELIRKQVPEPEKNCYFGLFSKVERVLLEALYGPVDRTGFDQISRRIVPQYKMES